jgi:redox-sensitive bicupin YhaK (pirin superfamily)
MASQPRGVARTIESIRTLEGGGFPVRRPFPSRELLQIDPFLLLDEMGPVDWPPGGAIGAPDHPHRGFETVTYLLEGAMQHRDSRGNSGRLDPGSVQWMTAGSGVVHSEMPETEFARRGGRMHGFQLWVNLPRRDKWIAPRYQDVSAARIPVTQAADGKATLHVIAGEVFGTRAAVETRVPILYVHASLRPGAVIEPAVPAGHTAFAYVFRGAGRFGVRGNEASEGDLVLFESAGDSVRLENPATAAAPLELLLLAATPLNEPMERYGPFVMNTKAEILQAIEDFRAGRLGEIPAPSDSEGATS